ncbi:hemerythrin domain-containing protein [Caenimonas soli]|jgi:hemerythrin-like domain-containing protein|uniref:hemerythrin domain-containing protein n=1 Tax=Caenimonas soli TaxID=2735555 RepID=UPI001554B8C1|nr:hemerythrin domain-containing protein [Caenimonas soli]NPC55893.1 hemerythrin domain-containing protein [Caenimonas soli]
MTDSSAVQIQVEPDTPIAGFSRCHVGILSGLATFAELPALVRAAERARRVAAATLALFEDSILEHHADEESELFVAVQRSAAAGPESDLVQAMVQRLTSEHRTIEALWKRVKPGVKLAASARAAELDTESLAELVSAYTAHARFEEQEFLPLAQQILGRDGNHLAALGIALHLRHVPPPIGYI